MDRIDSRILSILQKNSQISMGRLSEQVGLSLSACHRRVKMMESDGRISHYSAQLDRAKLGIEIQVFIEVKLVSHRREDLDAFEESVMKMDDVLECHLISGEFDFLIRVAATNPADFERLHRDRLADLPAVQQMKTLLSMRTVKEFTGYNLEALATN
ncbi:Lrp/AsnC family transcriptional regulator [Cognatishimia sp. SS12]|nr:Lrp/AsnC family transcriptional regulator [Cognatishimia sp. SS12]